MILLKHGVTWLPLKDQAVKEKAANDLLIDSPTIVSFLVELTSFFEQVFADIARKSGTGKKMEPNQQIISQEWNLVNTSLAKIEKLEKSLEQEELQSASHDADILKEKQQIKELHVKVKEDKTLKANASNLTQQAFDVVALIGSTLQMG
ncbi:hypothetical protein RYX36_007305 [Vicia faba]